MYRRKPTYRKKSYRKKKMFRKRRTYKRRSAFDTPFKVTCNVSRAIEYKESWTEGEDLTQGRFGVGWGLNQEGGINGIGLRDSPEFMHWRKSFAKYRVTGIKMTWRPYIQSGTNTTMREFQTWTLDTIEDPDSTFYSRANGQKAVDWHE